MKHFFTLCMVVVLLCMGCKPQTNEVFSVWPQSIELAQSEGETVSIEVTTAAKSWVVASDKLWCIPLQTSGSGNGVVEIEIAANIEPDIRTATITLTTDGASKEIRVTQQASSQSPSAYRYQLPVIVHVLCTNLSDPNQNIERGYMAEIIDRVNKLFANKVDMKVKFVMAPNDPNGRPLEEPGVHRVLYQGAFPIDCIAMMETKNNEFKAMLWDANRYVNIFVYPFDKDLLLGLSHLPITPTTHFLPGTNEAQASYITLNDISFTYCLSLNRTYLYQRSNDEVLNLFDFVATTTHELGHFLGLHHVFAENDEGEMIEDCIDSDYCTDTPSYNRLAYERWLETMPENSELSKLIVRTPCNGAEFNSTNVMDYFISLNNEFTTDQSSRVRHVLNYGVLMPGPKIDQKTRFTKGVTPEIPFRVVI